MWTRNWPFYTALVLALLGTLGGLAALLRLGPGLDAATLLRAALLYAAFLVAAATFLANAWYRARDEPLANALAALQTLRTDREYLINIHVVTRQVRALGRPLSPALAAEFRRTNRPSSVEAPSFRNASLFVLNQYEFLAAGVRAGAIDYRLVETTLRGPLVALVQSYAPQINDLRRDKPQVFANLPWLYRRFRHAPPFDRGPIP